MTETDQDIVDALCDVEAGLTPWELDFVESIAGQVEGGRELTEGQREKAREILARLGL